MVETIAFILIGTGDIVDNKVITIYCSCSLLLYALFHEVRNENSRLKKAFLEKGS